MLDACLGRHKKNKNSKLQQPIYEGSFLGVTQDVLCKQQADLCLSLKPLIALIPLIPLIALIPLIPLISLIPLIALIPPNCLVKKAGCCLSQDVGK